MFVKQCAPPKAFFVTDVLYNWIGQFKISGTNVWRRNLLLEIVTQTVKKWFWHIWPWWYDLWPSDPKINRVPLLSMMNVWTKYEVGRSRLSRVVQQKRFLHIWPRWPWPLTPKSIGFIWYSGWMYVPSLKKVGQSVLR